MKEPYDKFSNYLRLHYKDREQNKRKNVRRICGLECLIYKHSLKRGCG